MLQRTSLSKSRELNTTDRNIGWRFGGAMLLTIAMIAIVGGVMAQTAFVPEERIQSLLNQFTEEHGRPNAERFERGVRQVAQRWRESDGSLDEFAAFCHDNYISDPVLLQQTANHLEKAFESIDGHLGEMGRDLSFNLDVETGPILPIDDALGRYSPYAHLSDDMFQTKIAFIILLNYPLYSLDELLKLAPALNRDEWAQARMAMRYRERVPPEVSQVNQAAFQAAGDYIRDYNIWMHHLLDARGKRLFPAGLRLITHWNLRDELKARYSDPNGLPKQEMIYDVMCRIIRQQVPAAVINNPAVDWKMSTNEVTISRESDGPARKDWNNPGKKGDRVDNSPELDTRYRMLLGTFRAQLETDKYYPSMPTLIQRRFERDREMPEAEVEKLCVSILSSDELANTAKLIQKRLGRLLQPFDIWYDGFKPRSTIPQAVLDSAVRAKYPNAEAFWAGIPSILKQLGFDSATTQYVTARIVVDPSRGAGHAAGPSGPEDKAHLRTRVESDGMNYKGYNIACHELGHNVEQVFSGCKIDYTLLAGVPNTAFTEALAFVFQARDLQLLGIPDTASQARYLSNLDDYWGACEIAAVSLVDMKVWHWMYDNPDATPAELKTAVIGIAKEIWNQYYATAFGIRDADILAVYSHMIDAAMYLPDYTIGCVIAFQIEQYLKTHSLGAEMERMCVQGSITPDLWMQRAVGASISAEPMLTAAKEALAAVK